MTDWYQQAACRGATAVFFPGQGGPTKPAKRICAGCPVSAQCAEVGMGELHGVWGGMSERQRRRIRTELGTTVQRKLPPACGTEAGYARHRRAGELSCRECSEAHVSYVREWKLRAS